MTAELTFELRLEERRSDRVYVAVVLAPPTDRPVPIEGVAVQLFQRSGEAGSSRLLLPIAGTLTQPMISTVELRAHGGHLPNGSRVVGTVWNAQLQSEATCPADMWTELESHVRGTRIVHPRSAEVEMRALRTVERARLASTFPWLGRPVVVPFDGVLEPEEPQIEEELDALCAEYGLCGEEADFLKELLTEDEI